MMRAHSRRLSGLMLVALAPTTWAQDSSEPIDEGYADVVTLPEARDDTSSMELPDIIVTGEKTARRLEDTASSVQVIRFGDIETSSMDTLYDAYQRTANVNMDSAGLGKVGGFVIRGISSAGVTPQSFATSTTLASVFVDGVPLSSAGALSGPLDLWDVDSIEFLRGPQSTNQGQSALAGAVLLNTREPGDTLNGRARIASGDDGQRQYAAAIGGPLFGDIGLRLSYDDSQSDGASTNITRSEASDFRDSSQARAKLAWQPDGNASVMLSLSRSRNHLGQAQLTGDPQQRQSAANDPEELRSTTDVISLRAGLSLTPRWDITSLSGFSTTQQQRLDDYNASPQDDGTIENHNDDRTLTQELRANFGGGEWLGRPLRGVIGAFASLRDNDSMLYVIDGNVTGGQPVNAFLDIDTVVDQRREGYALFSEVEWDLTPRWTLSTGLRYDHETLDYAYQSESDLALFTTDPLLIGDLLGELIAGPLGVPADADSAGRADSQAWLPKLGLRYALSSHTTLGATLQRAYRAGGLSVNFVRGDFSTFDPEYATTGELFLRTALWQRRARLRVNVFYTDWRDQQVAVQLSDDPNDTQTENAGRSKLYGGEVELDIRFTHALSGFVSAGYTRTEFVEFNSAGGDYSGNRFPSAPQRQGAVGMLYEPALLGPYAQIDLNYVDDTYRTPDNDPEQTSDAYALLNARLGWRIRNAELYLSGRNLLDRFYLQQRAFGLFVAGPPRSVMAGIELHWN